MRVSCESFFQQSKTGEDLLVMGGNYTWRWEAGEVGMDGYAKKIGNTKVWRGWA